MNGELMSAFRESCVASLLLRRHDVLKKLRWLPDIQAPRATELSR
jgi:hypothetical protein